MSEQKVGEAVRLSVVLDSNLLEHVRIRAFEERKSKSAYVRDLVVRDAASGGAEGSR